MVDRIKQIEKKMKELLILCNKEEIWGWTKRFEVGEISKDEGYYLDFHMGVFKKRCMFCNQPVLNDGLVDLDDIDETKTKNKGRKKSREFRCYCGSRSGTLENGDKTEKYPN